jgi:hypothetical protein
MKSREPIRGSHIEPLRESGITFPTISNAQYGPLWLFLWY